MKKYIKNFDSLLAAKQASLYSPLLMKVMEGDKSIIVTTVVDEKDTELVIKIDSLDNIVFEKKVSGPTNNEIWYTTKDGQITKTTYSTGIQSLNDIGLLSNEVDGDHCVMRFNKDVTSIGNYAFFRCSSLTSITIPDSVMSIGTCAFYGWHRSHVCYRSKLCDKHWMECFL